LYPDHHRRQNDNGEDDRIHRPRSTSRSSASVSSSRATPCAFGLGGDLEGEFLHLLFRIARRRGLGDEGPHTALLGQNAVTLQLGIGALHGVEIDLQRHRHLAHGGNLRARLQRPTPDQGQDLLAQLDIDRDAVVLDGEAFQHCRIV
jgi:hypothetical protein